MPFSHWLNGMTWSVKFNKQGTKLIGIKTLEWDGRLMYYYRRLPSFRFAPAGQLWWNRLEVFRVNRHSNDATGEINNNKRVVGLMPNNGSPLYRRLVDFPPVRAPQFIDETLVPSKTVHSRPAIVPPNSPKFWMGGRKKKISSRPSKIKKVLPMRLYRRGIQVKARACQSDEIAFRNTQRCAALLPIKANETNEESTTRTTRVARKRIWRREWKWPKLIQSSFFFKRRRRENAMQLVALLDKRARLAGRRGLSVHEFAPAGWWTVRKMEGAPL